MENYFEILKKNPLFAGIDGDLPALLICLDAKEVLLNKNGFIFTAGDKPGVIGAVLEGSAHIVQEDYWGNRTILSAVVAGGLFGEAFALAQSEALPVSVIAAERCRILLLDGKRLTTACSHSCGFHSRLIGNMLRVIAGKNVMLTQKIEHLTKKTTQEKVLSYLSERALISGKSSFDIPFNRQELADYLSVERSALSEVLSRMRKAGTLDFDKNRFRLLR